MDIKFLISNLNDLQKELLEIQNRYSQKQLTKLLFEEILIAYDDLFNRYGLNDLKYRVIEENASIKIIPLRTIDHYAFIGILHNIEVNSIKM